MTRLLKQLVVGLLLVASGKLVFNLFSGNEMAVSTAPVTSLVSGATEMAALNKAEHNVLSADDMVVSLAPVTSNVSGTIEIAALPTPEHSSISTNDMDVSAALVTTYVSDTTENATSASAEHGSFSASDMDVSATPVTSHDSGSIENATPTRTIPYVELQVLVIGKKIFPVYINSLVTRALDPENLEMLSAAPSNAIDISQLAAKETPTVTGDLTQFSGDSHPSTFATVYGRDAMPQDTLDSPATFTSVEPVSYPTIMTTIDGQTFLVTLPGTTHVRTLSPVDTSILVSTATTEMPTTVTHASTSTTKTLDPTFTGTPSKDTLPGWVAAAVMVPMTVASVILMIVISTLHVRKAERNGESGGRFVYTSCWPLIKKMFPPARRGSDAEELQQFPPPMPTRPPPPPPVADDVSTAPSLPASLAGDARSIR